MWFGLEGWDEGEGELCGALEELSIGYGATYCAAEPDD